MSVWSWLREPAPGTPAGRELARVRAERARIEARLEAIRAAGYAANHDHCQLVRSRGGCVGLSAAERAWTPPEPATPAQQPVLADPPVAAWAAAVAAEDAEQTPTARPCESCGRHPGTRRVIVQGAQFLVCADCAEVAA